MCVHVYAHTCTIYKGRYAFEKLQVYYSICAVCMSVLQYTCVQYTCVQYTYYSIDCTVHMYTVHMYTVHMYTVYKYCVYGSKEEYEHACYTH